MLERFLKITIVAFILTFSIKSNAQRSRWVKQVWSTFTQPIPVQTDKKLKFKFQGDVKVIKKQEDSNAGMWVRVDNAPGEEYGFYASNDSIVSPDWKTYSIEGYIDEKAETIYIGAYGNSNGKFYFDNFQFYIENETGDFEKFTIQNPGFESKIIDSTVPGWIRGTKKDRKMRVKGFTYTSTNDFKEGKQALLVESKGVKLDSSYFINTTKEYTTQIGTLVSMLNNLSYRVESEVKLLNQREIDHLMDEKANRIGALLLHLAAAEAYYQVRTFENRGFNEDEKKKWSLALDLGDEAREKIKGYDVEYYLDIYKEVRKKTLEELKKRNDEWLNEATSSTGNRHFSWFHVMEHQSSHLGQIRMIKKRIPEDEKIKLPEEKVD